MEDVTRIAGFDIQTLIQILWQAFAIIVLILVVLIVAIIIRRVMVNLKKKSTLLDMEIEKKERELAEIKKLEE